jgi:regulator of RNase E activity RraA
MSQAELASAIELLKGLPTPAITDALDQIGHAGAMVDIAPLAPTGTRFAGPARTVLQGPRRVGADVGTSYTRHSAFVDHDVRPGEVVVVSTPPAVPTSSWGYLLSLRCQQLGAAGAVLDGSVRDPQEIAGLGYPIFVRAPRFSPAGSKYRLETLGTDVPVSCGGVVVEPGDIVVGDDSGVVVCPARLLGQVIPAAQEILAWEEAAAERIARGGHLVERDPQR